MNSSKTIANQHRKKKYVFKERGPPFPVPIASITRETPNKDYWFHYTGHIYGDHVIVTHSGDISYLQRMGYFGKGLMSRGAPSVYKSLPYVHIPSTNDGEPDVVHVMRRRMHLKHMKWKKSHDRRLTNQGEDDVDGIKTNESEDEEFDSDVEYTQIGHDHEGENSNFPQSNSASVIDNVPICSNDLNVAWQPDSTDQNTSSWSWDEEYSKQEVKVESWENRATTNENAATDSWDNMEADEDFWATEKSPGDEKEQKENEIMNTNEEVLKDFDNCDTGINEKKRTQNNKLFHNPNKKVKLTNNLNVQDSSNEHVTPDSVNQLRQVCEPNVNNEPNTKEHSERSDSERKAVTNTQQKEVHMKETELDTIKTERTKSDVTKEMKMKNKVEMDMVNRIKESDNCDSSDKLLKANTDNIEIETNKSEPLPIHPYCKEDDDDDVNDDDMLDDENDRTTAACDEFLVIDDSDIDDSTYVVQKKEKYTWLPVRKKEVFDFNEPLVLSIEEAYFLSYGLGCLTVKDESDSSLTLTDLWCRFCSKKQFLPHYVAYHYFRSKGWVPKPSLLFGTDFLVYKVGPEFYHASYSVIVRTVYEDTFEEVEEYNSGKVSWTGFFGINRVTEQVAKTLIYCYVIMPKDLTDEEKKSPDCIGRFKIRLQAIQRWISSQERDKEKVVDDEPVT